MKTALLTNCKLILFIAGAICPLYSEMKCDTLFEKADTFVTCKVYNTDGNLMRLKRYLNGKMHGIQEDYYDSGNRESIFFYKNGCQVDSSVSFHKNGRIESILYYTNCACNGPVLAFGENGDTTHKGKCVNGKTVGLNENWYKTGKREFIIHYNDSGKKHGLYETWREDGTRKDSIMYDNGKMVEIRAYFVNGKERTWEEYRKTDTSSFLLNAVYHDFAGKISGKVVKGEGEYIVCAENGRPVVREWVSKGIRIKEEKP
jgi:antitoxin component YwqK of YwqJK toxin-antitoxin module